MGQLPFLRPEQVTLRTERGFQEAIQIRILA